MDTVDFFLPAARAIQEGHSPYLVPGFFNPPWVLLLFLPFVNSAGARWIVSVLNLVAFAVLASRAGSGRSVVPFLLSPPVLFSLWTGNIDGLVLLGLYWGGSLVLSIKPQLTSGAMVYDAMHGRFPGRAVLGYAASIAMYGWWPVQIARQASMLNCAGWDHSLWPWGLLVGIPLLVWAVRTHRRDVALACSPFLCPYISGGGWCTLTLLLSGRWPWLMLFVDLALVAGAMIWAT